MSAIIAVLCNGKIQVVYILLFNNYIRSTCIIYKSLFGTIFYNILIFINQKDVILSINISN